VKGEPVIHSGTPASFSVLTNQIRGLALDIEPAEKPGDSDA
jgi:DNA-directed RNA polymerase beta subunit